MDVEQVRKNISEKRWLMMPKAGQNPMHEKVNISVIEQRNDNSSTTVREISGLSTEIKLNITKY